MVFVVNIVDVGVGQTALFSISSNPGATAFGCTGDPNESDRKVIASSNLQSNAVKDAMMD